MLCETGHKHLAPLDNTVFTVAGRHYELMAEPQPWVEALFIASKAHCFGMPGHLATFETEAEWQVRMPIVLCAVMT